MGDLVPGEVGESLRCSSARSNRHLLAEWFRDGSASHASSALPLAANSGRWRNLPSYRDCLRILLFYRRTWRWPTS